MQEVMGHLPFTFSKNDTIITHSVEEFPLFTRLKISYEGEPGDFVPAYLLIPKVRQQKVPGILCLHETNDIGKNEPVGIGGNPDLHYAKELAEQGYVCLAPDYPYLGENKFDPYANGYVSCSMKGIVNHKRAIDILQSLPQVDGKRIGVIGHSLGGHNALFVAMFDDRVKAIVSSCGFTTKKRYAEGIGGGDLTGWTGVRYMPLIASVYGKDPNLVPFDFPELLVSLAPTPLFINAPINDTNFDVLGVKECISKARPFYQYVFKSNKKLVVVYPDANHEFPKKMRLQSYAFLNKWLRK